MKKVKWTESFDFSRAKASEFKITLKGYLKLFLFYLTLFVCLFLFITVHNIIETLIWAVVTSLFFLGFTWVVGFLPQSVYINKNGVGSGRAIILYKDIDMAVVGTMELKGKAFNILSVITIENIQYIYGLAEKIDPQKLADTLKEMGVNVQ